MTDWQNYWSTHPQRFASKEHLKQVGKTVGGVPISDEQFQSIIDDICRGLQLKEDDTLLDLCCGNGLITNELSRRCKSVVGVDYSEPLIEVARRDHCPDNVEYYHQSVMELDRLAISAERRFEKVVMYEALQHFRHSQFATLLSRILPWTSDHARLFFGSVPDRARVWNFANTPKRKAVFLYRHLTGRNPIGSWWRTTMIQRTGAELDCRAEIGKQSENLHTSHYRFDILLEKNDTESTGP